MNDDSVQDDKAARLRDYRVSFFIRVLFDHVDKVLQLSRTLGSEICKDNPDDYVVLDSLDQMVDHAARASQILFPGPEKYRQRGRDIRSRLSVDDDHFLDYKSRDLRHFLQHFDEKLDNWIDATDFKVSAYMGVFAQNIFSGVTPTYMKIFFIDKFEYWCLSEKMEIKNLISACQDILDKIRAYNKTTGLADYAEPEQKAPPEFGFKEERSAGTNEFWVKVWPIGRDWPDFVVMVRNNEIDFIKDIVFLDETGERFRNGGPAAIRSDDNANAGLALNSKVTEQRPVCVYFRERPSYFEFGPSLNGRHIFRAPPKSSPYHQGGG